MGYSNEEDMVRVDFFKSSGKWYTTEAVKWTGDYYGYSLADEFSKSLRDHFGKTPRLGDMDAVCLEPYSTAPYPIMLRNGGWNNGI